MNIFHKFAFAAFGLATVFYTQSSQAAVFSEVGDAGDTFGTSQIVSGSAGQSLDTIEGNLSSLQDNDFFRFFYDGTVNLTIQTGPYTNTPFPTNTFPGFELLSATGTSLGGAAQSNNPAPFGNQTFIVNGSADFITGTSNISYGGLPVGEYVLRVDGTGQRNFNQPRYLGNYSVRLQGGAQFIQAVPEPTSILSLLAVAAMGSITVIKNHRQKLVG
ncbi:PEP-CTERM sorting domain-containing protein [Nostoc sp. FACHB-973]|nr:PEP-CTERM sorting domain-containing protein [Nostoc sp. FACHB-973]MBX9255507.1 PEP-CTERM sorting domain-containing protein [Desmonostoc muscorum CCALA 125]